MRFYEGSHNLECSADLCGPQSCRLWWVGVGAAYWVNQVPFEEVTGLTRNDERILVSIAARTGLDRNWTQGNSQRLVNSLSPLFLTKVLYCTAFSACIFSFPGNMASIDKEIH